MDRGIELASSRWELYRSQLLEKITKAAAAFLVLFAGPVLAESTLSDYLCISNDILGYELQYRVVGGPGTIAFDIETEILSD